MDLDEYQTPAIPKRRPCPACGEMIVATAAKCRFCKEIFDETLKRKQQKKRKKKRSRSASYDGELTAVDWVLCILCGTIGCIVGIVACIQGDSSRGGKMIGISILCNVLWNIFFTVVRALMEAGG